MTMSERVKICILTIPDREHYVSDAQFHAFTDAVIPVFKEKFPDTEFMFMSRELNLVSSGLDEFERLLFEIKTAIDELKNLSSNQRNINEEKKE